MKYKLDYKYEDPEELKNDTSWHKCHSFTNGWFWERPSDRASVYAYELDKYGITFNEFPALSSENIESIVAEVAHERAIELEKRRKHFEENPIDYTRPMLIPKIKKKFPMQSISEMLYDVQQTWFDKKNEEKD